MKHQLPAYLSELAGTAIMMAIGVGAIALFWAPGIARSRIDPERLRLLATGMIFAGGATLVVYSPLGRMSGGHLNPAVTCAFWRLGRIDSRDAVVYAIAQTIGAIAGVAAVRLVAGDLGTAVELGMTRPGMGVSSLAACVFEVRHHVRLDVPDSHLPEQTDARAAHRHRRRIARCPAGDARSSDSRARA